MTNKVNTMILKAFEKENRNAIMRELPDRIAFMPDGFACYTVPRTLCPFDVKVCGNVFRTDFDVTKALRRSENHEPAHFSGRMMDLQNGKKARTLRELVSDSGSCWVNVDLLKPIDLECYTAYIAGPRGIVLFESGDEVHHAVCPVANVKE